MKKYSAKKDSKAYFNRTQRNHYWIGGPEGQARIQKLRIGVAGLGGMGSHIAELLVRLGVGHVRIADPDHIEATNINRQVIANQETLGVGKAEASAAELRKITEDFELVVFNQGITEETVVQFVEGCDAIVDEIDVFPIDKHIILHRECRKRGIPIYSSYVLGIGIHFYKFHGNDYKYEDFMDNRPKEWVKPTGRFLLDRLGPPYSSYLKGKNLKGFEDAINTGGAPIFGPATLLGQSLVTTRLLIDLLKNEKGLSVPGILQGPPTPVMPQFLVIDPVDFSFEVAEMPEAATLLRKPA